MILLQLTWRKGFKDSRGQGFQGSGAKVQGSQGALSVISTFKDYCVEIFALFRQISAHVSITSTY